MVSSESLQDSQIQAGMVLTYAPNFYNEWSDLGRLDVGNAKEKAQAQSIRANTRKKQARTNLTVIRKADGAGWVINDGKQTFMTYASCLAFKK